MQFWRLRDKGLLADDWRIIVKTLKFQWFSGFCDCHGVAEGGIC